MLRSHSLIRSDRLCWICICYIPNDSFTDIPQTMFWKYCPIARFPAWHQYSWAIWTGSITEDNNTCPDNLDLGIFEVRPRQAEHPHSYSTKSPKPQFLYYPSYGHFLNYNFVNKKQPSFLTRLLSSRNSWENSNFQ